MCQRGPSQRANQVCGSDAATLGSITFLFYRRETTSISAFMAPDAEALTTTLLVCGEPGCENQPWIAKPGQTTGKPTLLSNPSISHFFVPAWGTVAKNLQPLLQHLLILISLP